MKSALRRTGLSADVLRSWENRYQAISPERSAGGHRLYSEDDIERLILLQRLLAMGRRIGQVASLRTDQLRTMLMDEAAAVVGDTGTAVNAAEPFLHQALQESGACDAASLDRTLRRALVMLGFPAFLDHLVSPMLERLRQPDGDRTGGCRVAHAVIASLLAEARRMLRPAPGAQRVLIAAPQQAPDEVGLQMLATTAAAGGWDVVYLGAGLPAAALAETASGAGVRVVAVWLQDGDAAREARPLLRTVRELIPAEVAFTVSGPGATERARDLTTDGLSVVPEQRSFAGFLESFR